MEKLIPVLLYALGRMANSNSLGKPSMCHAKHPDLGCAFWNRNSDGKFDQQDCGAGNHNRYMFWTDKPRHAPELFSIETLGSSCEYVPGEYVTFRIIQHDAKLLYRGLMMYAVSDTDKEERVGSWFVPSSGSASELPKFWTPWSENKGHPCEPVLTHSNAEVKDLHEVMRFRAPKKGTGKITIRVLLKTGVANEGHFFYPNDKDLELYEAPSQPRKWLLGSAGQTCDSVCDKAGRRCDSDAMAEADKAGREETQVAADGIHECRFPFLSSCERAAPMQKDSKDRCYYYDKSRCGTHRDICKARPPRGTRRICACSQGVGIGRAEPQGKGGTCASEQWVSYKDRSKRPKCCRRAPVVEGPPEDCDERLLGNTDVTSGVEYKGCQIRTISGKTCQKWTATRPHKPLYTSEEYPGKGLGDHRYCRNPDGVATIWCYTTDPNMKWDYCVPRVNGGGGSRSNFNYIGYNGGCGRTEDLIVKSDVKSPPLLLVKTGVKSLDACKNLCADMRDCAAVEYCAPLHRGTCGEVCRLLPGPVSQYSWGNGRPGLVCHIKETGSPLKIVGGQFSGRNFNYKNKYYDEGRAGGNFHVPDLCYDNNKRSFCMVMEPLQNKWLMVDLGSPKQVDQVYLLTNAMAGAKRVNLFTVLWPSFELWVGNVRNNPWGNKKCGSYEYHNLPFPYYYIGDGESTDNNKDPALNAFVNCYGVGRYVYVLLPGTRSALRLLDIVPRGSSPNVCDDFDSGDGCGDSRCEGFRGGRGSFVDGGTMDPDVAGEDYCDDGYAVSPTTQFRCSRDGGRATADGQVCEKCTLQEWNPLEAARTSSVKDSPPWGGTNKQPNSWASCSQLDGCPGYRLGGSGAWFGMDGGSKHNIAGVVLQRPKEGGYIIAFKVMSSLDGNRWNPVDGGRTFNVPDQYKRSVEYKFHAKFQRPVYARWIRIQVSSASLLQEEESLLQTGEGVEEQGRGGKGGGGGKPPSKGGVGIRCGLLSCRTNPKWRKVSTNSKQTCSESNENLIQVDWTVDQGQGETIQLDARFTGGMIATEMHCKQLCEINPYCNAIFNPKPKQGMRIDGNGVDMSGCFMFKQCNLNLDQTAQDETARDDGDASALFKKEWKWIGDTHVMETPRPPPDSNRRRRNSRRRSLLQLDNSSIKLMEKPIKLMEKPSGMDSVAHRPKAASIPTSDEKSVSARAAESVSTRASSFVAWLALGASMSLASGSSSVAIAIATLAMLPQPSTAHNWFTSPARRMGSASTIPPCQGIAGQFPHVAVKPGQEFVAEWSTGHGGPVWMTIVKAEDQDRLPVGDAGKAMVEDYLKEAEAAGSESLYPKLGHMAHHGGALSGKLKGTAIKREESPWGARPSPPQFSGRGMFGEFREYDDKHIANIMRVESTKIKRYEYKSRKYPFIVAVHRFPITFHRPKDVDVVRMAIHRPGKYIMQFLWHGYYDCTDVVVLDQSSPTNYPYGQIVESLQSRMVRIDHCQYINHHNSGFCSEAYPDPNHCLSNCDRALASGGSLKTALCMGVNIVPLRPKQAISGGVTNLPSSCDYLFKPGNNFQLKDDALLCYGVHPRPKTDVMLEYEISLDPRNPIFYSTCYHRQQAIQFEGLPPPNFKPSQQFLFSDLCASCKSIATNAQAGKPARAMIRGAKTIEPGILTPRWEIAEDCVECDEEPARADPTPEEAGERMWGSGRRGSTCSRLQPYANGGSGVPSYGRDSRGDCRSETCAKFIETPGQRRGNVPVVFNVQHCKALAARDPDCNDAVVWYGGISSSLTATASIHFPVPKGPKGRKATFQQGNACICVKKSSCCSGCRAASESQHSPTLYKKGSLLLDEDMEPADNVSSFSAADDDGAVVLIDETLGDEDLQNQTHAEDGHPELKDSRDLGFWRLYMLPESDILSHGGLEECEGENFPEYTDIWNTSSPRFRALTSRQARMNNLLGLTSRIRSPQAQAQPGVKPPGPPPEARRRSPGRRRSPRRRSSPPVNPPSPPGRPPAPVDGPCVKPYSLPADCSPCLENRQCGDGVCDPIMKRCVKDRDQRCDFPSAGCIPPCGHAACKSCKENMGSWQKPTCGGNQPPTKAPTSRRRSPRRRKGPGRRRSPRRRATGPGRRRKRPSGPGRRRSPRRRSPGGPGVR